MKKVLFIVTLFIFCIGLCCVNNTVDNDLWARLIAGGHIVETLRIAKADFVSYTQTHPWYDHEWGASIFFYLALKYFGTNGLILLKGILSALTIFVCFKTVELNKPKSTNAYNILYFAFMYWVVFKSLGPVVRCLLFTCLFFAIFVYILEKSRLGNKKVLIFLPFLMILWSNIHGGCLSGIGLILLYCIGEFLNKKSFKEYFYTILGCLAALFINPYGLEYVKFLFYAALMKREYITEWTSPFHNKYILEYLRYKLYLVFVLLIQFIYLAKNKISYQKIDKTKLVILLVVIYLSVTHIRHIPFFVLTAGTLLYDEFYSLFNSLLDFCKEKLKIKDGELTDTIKLLKEVAVYFLLLICTLPPLLAKEKDIKITDRPYPRFAIEFIKINNITGNLFINFDWGSYASYKLYPHNLIVMDGRYEEVYDPNLLLDMKNFHLVKDDWYKIIREYQTDVILIEKKYPVYKKLIEHSDWKAVFDNDLFVVFVPTAKLKDEYLFPTPEDDYYNKTIFNTDITYKKKAG